MCAIASVSSVASLDTGVVPLRTTKYRPNVDLWRGVIVAAMRQNLRPGDGIYRFGGEEFLVVLDSPTEASLAVAAERLRAAVASIRIDHPDNVPFGVATISLGAVWLTPADLEQSDDEWFARADAALYQAKKRGRNRVQLAAT